MPWTWTNELDPATPIHDDLAGVTAHYDPEVPTPTTEDIGEGVHVCGFPIDRTGDWPAPEGAVGPGGVPLIKVSD